MKKNKIKQSVSLFNKLTCEHINSRSHFPPHATCNCPARQAPHVPVHLCLQASILSHGFGQENRFNSCGDEIMRHGTLITWSQANRFDDDCLQSLAFGVLQHSIPIL
jgi:hypothetical protein